MWEQLNGLYLRLREAQADGTWAARPHYRLRLVIDGVHLFQGVTDATMGHGEGWHYIQVGRFLERADVDGDAARPALRRTVGRARQADRRNTSSGSACCGRARRSRPTAACYTADLRPERIAEFLLLNAEFPRSVRLPRSRVESSLRSDRALTARGAGGRAERLAGRLHASLDYGQVDEILSDDPHALPRRASRRQCEQIHAARVPDLHRATRSSTALPA